MAIFVDEKNKVVVQGATGHQGVFHIGEMKNFGTKVVAKQNNINILPLRIA